MKESAKLVSLIDVPASMRKVVAHLIFNKFGNGRLCHFLKIAQFAINGDAMTITVAPDYDRINNLRDVYELKLSEFLNVSGIDSETDFVISVTPHAGLNLQNCYLTLDAPIDSFKKCDLHFMHIVGVIIDKGITWDDATRLIDESYFINRLHTFSVYLIDTSDSKRGDKVVNTNNMTTKIKCEEIFGRKSNWIVYKKNNECAVTYIKARD